MSKGQARIKELEEEVARLHRELIESKAKSNRLVDICQQMMFDAFCFTVHDLFKVSKGRMYDTCCHFRDRYMEIMTAIKADSDDDADFEYAKADIDNGLRAIIPDDQFQPYDDRYHTRKWAKNLPDSRVSLIVRAQIYEDVAKRLRAQAEKAVR